MPSFTRLPCLDDGHPGEMGRFCLGISQHRPVREAKSIRLRIFVLPSSWTPL
jgi:hypothetical protein